MKAPVSSATVICKQARIACSVLLVLVLGYASCGPRNDTQPLTPTPRDLEFRIVLDRKHCGEDCKIVEFSSIHKTTQVLWVREFPDLVLKSTEIKSVIPTSLSSLDISRPESILWTGILNLAPEAVVMVRNLGSDLSAQDRILVSMDGEPLEVIYARLLRQHMALGAFSSREELVEKLRPIAEVQEGSGETIEVFTLEELAAERERDELLKESERARSEIEKIQGLAAEGKITREEVVKRLRELRREDAGS